MKAEKTRNAITRCTFAGENIGFYEEAELFDELSELETKAAKWDMIQWAIEKGSKVFQCDVRGEIRLVRIIDVEFDKLERLYKERENHG